MKLFILAGQSNMVGYESNLKELPSSLEQLQKNVIWYDKENQWSPLQVPTEPVLKPDKSLPVPPFESYHPDYSHAVANGVGFGPEISLGVTIATALNEKVAIVKYARNGTNLAEQWQPGQGADGNPKNTLYYRTLDRVQLAIAALTSLGYNVEIAGFFWMQGESDASNEKWANNYESNLTNFIGAVRRDFNNPNLPFVYGMVHFGNNHLKPNGKANCCGDIVRTAQLNVNQKVPFTRVVETRDLSKNSDQLHFDSEGIIRLGDRFGDEWLSMQHLP